MTNGLGGSTPEPFPFPSNFNPKVLSSNLTPRKQLLAACEIRMFHPAFVAMSFEVLFFFKRISERREIRGPQVLSFLPQSQRKCTTRRSYGRSRLHQRWPR